MRQQQLAKAFGARAYATAGSAEKVRACLDLGADGAVNYREADFVEELRAATDRRGIDVILCMVGGDYANRNLRLLVLDALRPQRVQEAIWRDVAGTPMAPYFADPVIGSIHSHGMAVDVTLVDAGGREADMGSGYDEMTPASHPALHDEHLARGVLSPAQVAERGWLHDAMAQGGFAGIDTEWWHFDHGDRDAVRRALPRVD